jgi:hypothetical protein
LPEEWLIERNQQVGTNPHKPFSPSFASICFTFAAVFRNLRDIFVTVLDFPIAVRNSSADTVTLKCVIFRRSWSRTKKQYRIPNVSVGTVKKSIPAMAPMVSEERQPSFHGIWISRSSPDPSRDTPFRDIETQLLKFAPERSQRNPEQLVHGSQSTARSLGVQSEQLLMKSQVFKDEVLTGTETADQPAEEMSERRDHSRNHIGKVRIELCAKSFILQVYDVSARYQF